LALTKQDNLYDNNDYIQLGAVHEGRLHSGGGSLSGADKVEGVLLMRTSALFDAKNFVLFFNIYGVSTQTSGS